MTIQHNELQAVKHVEEGQCECGEVHHKKTTKPTERSKYAVVSVATGAGLIQTFKDMGVDYVVSGGQSMNPSTEDFINGFDTLNAENIIVFPNNKNIVLAAKQAAKIYKDSQVHVIETKTISQGFSALTMLDLNGEPEDIIEEMKEVISNVISGSITYSIRDTNIEGIDVHKDDFIAILDGKIVSSNKKRIDAVKGLLKAKDISNKDIVTIIYGDGVNQKEINEVVKYIEKNYSNLEVEVIEGNQEVYSYILVIE
jgi:dihydroxyacetone kinase-like predicted kinase